jgi:hypothetical protein
MWQVDRLVWIPSGISGGYYVAKTDHFGNRGVANLPVSTVVVKTMAAYLAEMQAFAQTVIVNKQKEHVEGGHTGYSCILRSKGEVEKQYNVDFNLGNTITINDTRLNVVYTGVVSGVIETIDSNGYSVNIEMGTLGASLEQRINKVI